MKKNVKKNAGMLMIMALLCSAFPALAQDPDLLVCSDKSYTLTDATEAAGTAVTYKWYEKVNAGTFSEVSGETGASLQRAATNAAGTYQYVREASGDNCPDGVPSNTYTVVVLKPTAPTIDVGTAAICQNAGSLTFTVDPAANTTYTWASESGTEDGTPSGVGNGTYTVSGAVYGTKEVRAAASVTYEIGALSPKTCGSAFSTVASAEVNPTPVVADVSDYDACGSGVKELEVTVAAGGSDVTGTASIIWYAEDNTSSAQVATGATYTTPNPITTTEETYYVGAKVPANGIECTSASLTPVVATISLYEGIIGGKEN